jgi:hypothetical protein
MYLGEGQVLKLPDYENEISTHVGVISYEEKFL